MEKRRSGAQSIAKAMMIIGVIFFHGYLLTFDNAAEALGTFNILVTMFPFLLATFFFYSGYNYKPSERTFKENVARRAKQLLIPLAMAFVLSTVLIGAMELAFHYAEPEAILKALGNTVLYGLMSEPLAFMSGFVVGRDIVFELVIALGLLWFLVVLFICSVFFFLLVKYTNKRLSTLVSVVAALLVLAFCLGQFVGVYLPYWVQCYPVVLAIMLTGAHLRKYNFLEKEITCKKDAIIVGINALLAEGIVIGVGLFCYYRFGSTTAGMLPGSKFDDNIKGFDAFVAFLFAIAGTYFIHNLSRLIEKIPYLSKGLVWVGDHSAIFYLFHPIFLDLFAIAVFQKRIEWGIGQAFFYAAVVFASLVLVCLLLDFLIKKRKNKREAIPSAEREQQD